MNTQPPSAGLLGDLEDARAELKDLERAENRGRKAFAASMATLGVMAGGVGITNNGAFLLLFFAAAGLFAMAVFELMFPWRDVKHSLYADGNETLFMIEVARRKVRKLERYYTAAVMKQAGIDESGPR